MSGEGLVKIRGWLMGFAGLVCLAYGVLAIVMGLLHKDKGPLR